FGEKVAAGEKSEEYQIRLETDEKAVKIVTVHVSKGLEYPIVFCPYMWGGIKTDADIATFHDSFVMVKDFGSDQIESHRVLSEKETLAEGLRLLYVALTRAKYRCYLVAGKINDKTGKNRPETSPVSYLFHAPEEIRTVDDLVSRLAAEIRKLTAPDMEKQLEEIAGKADGAISVVPMPAADGSPTYVPSRDEGKPLTSRKPAAAIDRDWRVASFTSFSKRDAEFVELPDRDETGGDYPASDMAAAGEEPGGMSIFTFPKGAQAGIFMHGLFEDLDFSRADGEKVDELVLKRLEKSGYSAEWQPHIRGMVGKVVSTPIQTPSGSFSLCDLRKGSWIAELEFFFPLRFITSDLLSQCLRKWSGHTNAADLLQVCSSLGFRPVRGMLRGFMDMVFEHGGKFYLLDWKSNHLGNRPEDYSREKLGRAMGKNLYPLQYLLYTVALNRYLSLRVRDYDYDTCFGGVLYVFLRGVSPENGGETGVFRDIPPVAMVRELTELLVEADARGEEL
ncbi:MAG: exodeoxyribonuclease V subunit beta, partial [Deltaproteobacteria bacterium HGW-Deltaproteobacteria-11]